jgi:uncharacterized protein YneR
VSVCRDGKLVATARQGVKNWAVTWAGPEANEWYFVELTWDQEGGLKMFVDLRQVSSDSRGFMRDADQESDQEEDGQSEYHIYLGKFGGDMSDKAYGSATIDDLDIWYGERSKLIEIDFITRGEPLVFFTA